MKCVRLIILVLSVWGTAHLGGPAATGAAAANEPSFQEIYGLIRSNLVGVGEAELNQAALRGLLEQLRPRVGLVTNTAEAAAAAGEATLAKSELFEETCAYLRVAQVAPGLAKKIAESCQQLHGKKKLAGLIVDLRFANGQDYGSAAEVADLFLSAERPLLKVGKAVYRSATKTNAIALPLALLVNSQTAGAAEALAAVLHQAETCLVIGRPTAGQAHQFKEFALANGQRLRLAAGSIELGNGQALSEKGLSPDILVAVSEEDERAYFADPFKSIPKVAAQTLRPNATNSTVNLAGTNRPPRRRINETELVRMRREGGDPDAEPPAENPASPAKPVVNDPVLGRAIDLLKGLALVQGRR